jgi:hypothetical protein
MNDASVVRGRTRPSKTIGQTSKRDLAIIVLILEPTHTLKKAWQLLFVMLNPIFQQHFLEEKQF